ncbi:MAG: ornithine cyclodeaminase family protein [Candidatus Latescibacteria bacterium]|nr:ornithine cyclodeaminase family protein [Candidatus Latescibacterota bacterium]
MMCIHESDFAPLFTLDDWIASCDEAFRLYGQGVMINPPRVETVEKTDGRDLFRLRMSAEWVGRYRGEKVIQERSEVGTGRLGARSALITLEDLRTGARAEVEADLITNLRTGAAGALGARYLARPGAEVAAVLGTGRIAKALTLCTDRLFDLKEVRATSRKAGSRRAFAEEIGPRLRSPLRMMDSVSACVEDADIVLTAVPTATPILNAGDLKPEAHLSVMAGDSRTIQLDLGLLGARPVLVDEPDQAAESGEFRAARETGHYETIRLVKEGPGRSMTIGDAANGHLERLRGAGAIAYFTGLAAQDLHAAAMVYERNRGR